MDIDAVSLSDWMEWIFVLGWLIPVGVVLFAFVRTVRRIQTITSRFEDPEALAESLRDALEPHLGASGEDGERPRIEVTSNLDEIRRRLGSGSSRPDREVETGISASPRPTPFDAGSSRSSALRWILPAMVIAAAAWLVLSP